MGKIKIGGRPYPELLAPAGSEMALVAAVENGADAVYLGGSAFNARMHAGNFGRDSMRRAVDYAHKRGVRIYVTMNTLLRDEELSEALFYAGFLYETGVDALIIQDLGLGRLVRKAHPDFPLHLSTQATASDADAVRAAAALGYERVVLSRELSLSEIREAASQDAAEIEVFVHGALCICYSGQCQLSRHNGGRSGNRGACAQPCRLPYAALGDTGKKESGRYPLSPRDLCLIDHLGELIEAGACSFKIEGRMKSPEYVAVVTSIYRKYLDCCLREGAYRVSEEDRDALRQIFNRGGFTEGYFEKDPGRRLMAGDIPKNQGLYAGRVAQSVKGKNLIDIRPERPLEIGDGVEIYTKNGARAFGNVLSYVRERGEFLRIGDLKEEAARGDAVFRTSSRTQLEAARRTYENCDVEADERIMLEGEASGRSRKIHRRRPIRLHLSGKEGLLTLTAETVSRPAYGKWASLAPVSVRRTEGPFPADPAHAASEERIRGALMKSGNTPFEVEELSLSGELTLAVRMSDLNRLRREVLQALEQACCFRRNQGFLDTGAADSGNTPCGGTDTGFHSGADTISDPSERGEWFFYTIEKYQDTKVPAGTVALLPLAELLLLSEERGVPVHAVCEELERNGAGIRPYISNVSKGREDEILNRNFRAILPLARERGIYAGNLGWLYRLSKEDVPVYADFGLNAYNGEALRALKALGAKGASTSLEGADPSQGAYPLMTSEHRFRADGYRAKDGRKLRVIRRRYSSQTVLIAEEDGVPSGASVDPLRRCYIR